MWLNSVTLDVSKVTGWLNADVFCRVEGHAIRGARCAGRNVGEAAGAWGRGGSASVTRTRRSRDWAGHAPAAERTWNTPFM